MSKKEIIEAYRGLVYLIEEHELEGVSVYNTLQKMCTHFLKSMRRPNTAKKSTKGVRPAKFLKWFNTEER
jgi:hypothetical protein